MKIKCYSLYDGQKQIISEYPNLSQKDFLDYELKSVIKRVKKSVKIEFENTANGVWYIRQAPNATNLLQIMLMSKENASVSVAASFFNNAHEIQQKYSPYSDKQKLRVKITEIIRIFNANSKMDALNSNVMQLEEIVKGNVSKIVDNMGQLSTAERKSEMMAELSLQFEKDSRQLQKKMKRRKCLYKMLIAGIISIVLGAVIYILFY